MNLPNNPISHIWQSDEDPSGEPQTYILISWPSFRQTLPDVKHNRRTTSCSKLRNLSSQIRAKLTLAKRYWVSDGLFSYSPVWYTFPSFIRSTFKIHSLYNGLEGEGKSFNINGNAIDHFRPREGFRKASVTRQDSEWGDAHFNKYWDLMFSIRSPFLVSFSNCFPILSYFSFIICEEKLPWQRICCAISWCLHYVWDPSWLSRH